MSEQNLNISLTQDEALVFYEMISRFSGSENLPIEHQAELITLWNLKSNLEKELSDSLKSNYDESLQAARDNMMK